MLTDTNKKHQDENNKRELPKDHHKARKLSHEAAAQILDHEWKQHPGGG